LGSTLGTETITFIEFKFYVNAKYVVSLMLIKGTCKCIHLITPYAQSSVQ
jgi:hypothetical protein